MLLKRFRVACYWSDFASHVIETISRHMLLKRFRVACYWNHFASQCHVIEIISRHIILLKRFCVACYWKYFASHYIIETISRRMLLESFRVTISCYWDYFASHNIIKLNHFASHVIETISCRIEIISCRIILLKRSRVVLYWSQSVSYYVIGIFCVALHRNTVRPNDSKCYYDDRNIVKGARRAGKIGIFCISLGFFVYFSRPWWDGQIRVRRRMHLWMLMP